jgi:hypothetical protein
MIKVKTELKFFERMKLEYFELLFSFNWLINEEHEKLLKKKYWNLIRE